MATKYLSGKHARAKRMRVDTAKILKRYYFCERALIISQAGWLAAIPSFEIKSELPRFFWQDALTANALRERVFELRYPSRLMEVGEDAPLIDLFAESINAPSPEAFVLGMARVFAPAMLSGYQEYLDQADQLADGPTLRFIGIAVQEKAQQVALLNRFAREMLLAAPEKANDAESWVSTLNQRLFEVGGVSMRTPRPYIGSPELPGRRSYQLAQKPARDGQFQNCRYYWPDIVDPNFPYGEGLRLQLRSAVSHFNEVWAVESAGAVLHAFADDLPWEFVYDVARWTYDEARHCRMGLARLSEWDYHPDEIPLGSYIYDSARGQDPVVRLGQLHFFETKNIGSKTKRMEAFASYQDDMSQHDMDFDWADETIHAHYGRRWYDALRELYPERIPDLKTVLNLCSDLIEQEISTATDQDRTEIRNIAEAMINKAEEA